MIGKMFIGLFCGMMAGGVVLGVGGRMVMRALAVIAEREVDFSFSGTIEVVAFGAIIGSIAGAAFVAIKKYLPGATPLKGMSFGLLTFLALAIVRLPSVERSAVAFEGFLPPIVLMFGAVFLLYGIALAIAEEGLSRRFGSNENVQLSREV
jgi:hypothetical protein